MSLFLSIIDVLRELCMYYSTLGFLFSLSENALPLLPSIGICAVSGILCLLLKNQRTLGYLPLVLLAGLVFPGFTLIKLVSALPVVLLYVLKTQRDGWQADYDNVRRFMSGGLAGFGFASLVALVYLGQGQALTHQALPIFFVFLMFTIFELRMLRNDAVQTFGQKYVLLNFGLLAGILVIVLLLGSQSVLHGLLFLLKTFYTYIVSPVIFAFMFVLMVIPYAIYYLVMWIKPGGLHNMEIPQITSVIKEMFPEMEDTYVSNPWFDTVGRGLLIIAFLIIMYFVIRRMTDRAQHRSDGTVTYRRESLKPESGKKRRRSIFRLNDPDDVIREAYRSYLGLCAKEGIAVDGSIASDVICEQSEHILQTGDARKLRELWLPVRFSNDASDEQGNTAKELLRSIRKTFRREK
ncbi:MAG: hypothetical protein IKE36_01850 [Solobacterium sp.]|nr:hypothetical protein [Solobacterium sp.]